MTCTSIAAFASVYAAIMATVIFIGIAILCSRRY